MNADKPTQPSEPHHEELRSFIVKQDVFHGLKREHQDALVECAMIQSFAEGEQIFNEGDPANRFYFVLCGEVVLETPDGENQPLLIEKLTGGDILGWSWLFPPYYWHFGARATKPTRAIFFYGTRLRQLSEKDPSFGYELMRRIAGVVVHRLQVTRKELLDLSHRRR